MSVAPISASVSIAGDDDVNGEEELHKAAMSGDFDNVKKYIYPKWDINWQDKVQFQFIMILRKQ